MPLRSKSTLRCRKPILHFHRLMLHIVAAHFIVRDQILQFLIDITVSLRIIRTPVNYLFLQSQSRICLLSLFWTVFVTKCLHFFPVRSRMFPVWCFFFRCWGCLEQGLWSGCLNVPGEVRLGSGVFRFSNCILITDSVWVRRHRGHLLIQFIGFFLPDTFQSLILLVILLVLKVQHRGQIVALLCQFGYLFRK